MLLLGAALFFTLIYISRVFFPSYFNPLSFYSLVWGSVYFLYQLQLIEVPALRWQTLIILAIGHSMFIIGTIFPALAIKMKGVRSETTFQRPPVTLKAHYRLSTVKKMLLLLICLYTLRIVVGVLDIRYSPGGFLTLIVDPWSIRNVAGIEELTPSYFGRGVMLDLGGIGMSSLILAGYLLAVSPKKSLLYFLPLLISITDSTLNLQRSLGLQGIFYFVASYLYTMAASSTWNAVRLKIRARHVMLALFLGISFFAILIAGSEIVLKKSAGWDDRGYDAKINNLILNKMYWYIVGPNAAFDEHIKTSESDYKNGLRTFDVVAVELAKLGIVDKDALINAREEQETITVFYTTNQYTYLFSFFHDFGLIGIAILPFVFGAACSAAYFKMMKNFSLFILSLNCILAMTIFMSFTTFMLQTRQPILIVIAVWMIDLIMTRKSVSKRATVLKVTLAES